MGDNIIVHTSGEHTESTSISAKEWLAGGDLETSEPDENDTELDETVAEHREQEKQHGARYSEAPDMNFPHSREISSRHDKDETTRRVEEDDFY